MKLILHIGCHRTATSSIQKDLLDNAALLPAKGFLYPFAVRRHTKEFGALFNGLKSVEDFRNDILREVEATGEDVHTVILSEEDVCKLDDLSLLSRFTEFFDTKIVYSMRRQDLWLESWYLQNVRWQWDRQLCHLTFEDFMKLRESFHWIRYDDMAARFESCVGRDNVLLTVFERSQMPDGPIADFGRLVGLTDRTGMIEPTHQNSSLSPLMTEFMRGLPLNTAKADFRSVLERACAAVDTGLPHTNKSHLLMKAAERRKVLSEYDAGNKLVAKRYFGRDELFSDPVPDAKAPLAKTTLPAESAELMRLFVRPMIKEVIAIRQRNNKPNAGAPGTTTAKTA
jgi:hypothetical protein